MTRGGRPSWQRRSYFWLCIDLAAPFAPFSTLHPFFFSISQYDLFSIQKSRLHGHQTCREATLSNWRITVGTSTHCQLPPVIFPLYAPNPSCERYLRLRILLTPRLTLRCKPGDYKEHTAILVRPGCSPICSSPALGGCHSLRPSAPPA